MTLGDAVEWVRGVPASLPPEMRPMATDICDSFLSVARRLVDLGLDYLSLDRAGATLSTGERQRVQLARVVRNRSTGVLYVLDEPSIGLHPANVDGLVGVMRDLVDDGNTVVVVDHDTRVLAEADYLVEMGPVAGAGGGSVIAAGTVDEVEQSQGSRIAPFLRAELKRLRPQVTDDEMFDQGHIRMATDAIHTVKPLEVDIPRGRLVAVTGVSGSGKTTLVLETLIPALKAQAAGERLPGHVRWVDAEGIGRANLIDATPIGANVRSTVATYADIHDELRRAFARTPELRQPATRRAPLATTPAPCAALRVTARARYRSTCSFCPTSRSSAGMPWFALRRGRLAYPSRGQGRELAYVAAAHGHECGRGPRRHGGTQESPGALADLA